MTSTKIVATIGPASETVESLASLLSHGVSVFRFNLKHGTQAWHSERIGRVREASKISGKSAAILLDLQGPEIRTGEIPGGFMNLEKGEVLSLVEKTTGKKELLIPNPVLLKHLKSGDLLLVDDGKIHLRVEKHGKGLVAQVIEGGVMGQRKSVTIPSLSFDFPTLVEKDLEYISMASREDVDFIALSFVRTSKDVQALREEIGRQKVTADIIAKIETEPALTHFDEILDASDGVMVARGDLGVEMPIEQVPYYQKRIIRRCQETGKPVITATQMLESMIEHPYPTRAEVSDVANAVYDCTDAIMLSAETAAGKYPQKAVAMMAKTAGFIEKHRPVPELTYTMTSQTDSFMYAVNAFAIQQLCQAKNIKAFVILTESGYSARMLSRLRPGIPIIALTRHAKVRDKLMLSFGVIPVLFPFTVTEKEKSHVTQIDQMLEAGKKSGHLLTGDTVIMTYGDRWGISGNTNVMRIETVR